MNFNTPIDKEFFIKLFKKLSRGVTTFGKRTIALVLVLSFVFSLSVTLYNYLSASHYRSMTLTLNYEGAKKGLNPDGSRYNISDLKSDEVLERAIEILGDDRLSVSGVRQRIYINAKMPRSAIDTVTTSIAAGSSYSYNPSEFEIFYSQKEKFGKNNTVEFLHALSEAYNEHFTEMYSDKNNILKFPKSNDFSNYDYHEIYQILTDKVNSMIMYLGAHKSENSAFKSQNTGYSFENLNTMLINLRDIDLEKFEAFIVQNRISKDRTDFIQKQTYIVDEEMLQYNMNREASDIANNALDDYEAGMTGVAFIPSIDAARQYYMGRTKTGLDDLVNKSYSNGETAVNAKKSIDKRNDLIAKYTSANDSTEASISAANDMISKLCAYVNKISELSIQTDDDYISYKTNNYISFKLPTSGNSIPINMFIKYFVASAIAITILLKFASLAVEWFNREKENLEKKLHIDEEV